MPRRNLQDTLELGKERNLIDFDTDKIRYIVQNKEYVRDPEELVRAAVYVELVEDYNYSPHKIDFEVTVPRRTPCDLADIVVYQDEQRLNNYIVVETKKENCNDSEYNQAVEQGFGNANSLRASYLIIDNYRMRKCYDVANHPPNERQQNIIGDVAVNYGLVPTYRLKRGTRNDLRAVSFNDLAAIFRRCHNILWAGGKLDPSTAFDEMSKILFAKIQDERNTRNREAYKMQVGVNENEVIIAQKCIVRYDEARRIDPNVFNEPIKVSYSKIRDVVEAIQEVSMTETDLDAKGQAFENFLGVVFRGDLGQYFTRRQIVEFAVDLLRPNENDVILDPSCGSGGFLLYCMKKVEQEIRSDYEGNDALISRKIYDFSRQKLYGLEIQSKISRVAMMDMIVNDDGHSNIENNTGLNSHFNNTNIQYGKFSLILTNPPFGVKIKRDDRDNLGNNSFSNFVFGGRKKSQVSDILFLEQYKKFLTDDTARNPRAGIVLQVGVLNNPTNKDVIDWIKRNFKILAVVALPIFAFRKAGSGMKTCLLFVEKYGSEYDSIEDVPPYNVFFGVADHIGYDSTLRRDTNDLPQILENYRNGIEDNANGMFIIPFADLDYRLDAKYYWNKYLINLHFERLRNSGHTMIQLSKLLVNLEAGKSPKGGITRSTGEIPSIIIGNITQEGNLDFTQEINFVPDEFYDEFIDTKGGLQFHDILIAKDGATTGKTTIVDDSFPFMDDTTSPPTPKAIFSEHVFRLRLKEGVNPVFINAYLNSELGQLQMETITSGGGQGGITRGFVDNIYVPMIQEQAEIANHWLQGMAEANNLKNQYEQAVSNTKRDVDNLIENAPPLSQAEVEAIVNQE